MPALTPSPTTTTMMTPCHHPCPHPLDYNDMPLWLPLPLLSPWKQLALTLAFLTTTTLCPHLCPLTDDNAKMMTHPHTLALSPTMICPHHHPHCHSLTDNDVKTMTTMTCPHPCPDDNNDAPSPSSFPWQWCWLALAFPSCNNTMTTQQQHIEDKTSLNLLAHACKHMYTHRITICECMCACWHIHSACSYLWVNSCGYICRSFFADPCINQTPSTDMGFYWIRVRVSLLTPVDDLCYSLLELDHSSPTQSCQFECNNLCST